LRCVDLRLAATARWHGCYSAAHRWLRRKNRKLHPKNEYKIEELI